MSKPWGKTKRKQKIKKIKAILPSDEVKVIRRGEEDLGFAHRSEFIS